MFEKFSWLELTLAISAQAPFTPGFPLQFVTGRIVYAVPGDIDFGCRTRGCLKDRCRRRLGS